VLTFQTVRAEDEADERRKASE